MLKRLVHHVLRKRTALFLSFWYFVPALMLLSNSLSAQYVEGLMAVASEGKCGYANESGEIIIPAIYNKVLNFREGYAFVRLEKWGQIDKRAEMVIPAIHDSIWRFSSGAVVVRMADKLGLFRKDGKEICPIIYDDISVWYNLFAVKQSGKWGFIDQKGNVILPIEYDTAPVLATYDLTMKKNGILYTIDYKGEVIRNHAKEQ